MTFYKTITLGSAPKPKYDNTIKSQRNVKSLLKLS
jgi:hypothetical protein